MRGGNGAARGIRTPDPLITNQVLYQLSYSGLKVPLFRERLLVCQELQSTIPKLVSVCRLWCLSSTLIPLIVAPLAAWTNQGQDDHFGVNNPARLSMQA